MDAGAKWIYWGRNDRCWCEFGSVALGGRRMVIGYDGDDGYVFLR